MGISSQTCSYLLSYAWGKLSSVANLSLSCFSSSRLYLTLPETQILIKIRKSLGAMPRRERHYTRKPTLSLSTRAVRAKREIEFWALLEVVMEVPSAFLLSCFNWLWNHEFQWSFCFVFTSGRQLLKSLSKSELFIQHCLCIPSTLTSEKYE